MSYYSSCPECEQSGTFEAEVQTECTGHFYHYSVWILCNFCGYEAHATDHATLFGAEFEVTKILKENAIRKNQNDSLQHKNRKQ